MQWLMDLVLGALQSFLTALGSWAYSLLTTVSNWFIDYLWGQCVLYWNVANMAIQAAIEAILGSLPPGVAPDFPTLQGWFDMANYWVPIQEAFFLLVAMTTFWAAFCVFKYGWRLIPVFH
jgi:hypothetical protein